MFRAKSISDSRKRSLLIAGAFRETAIAWAQTLPEDVLENSDRLANAMRARFSFGKAQEMLRNELDQLKQDGSIEEYVRKFQLMMNSITNMSELDRIHAFKRNLKVAIKDRLPLSSVSSLDQMM